MAPCCGAAAWLSVHAFMAAVSKVSTPFLGGYVQCLHSLFRMWLLHGQSMPNGHSPLHHAPAGTCRRMRPSACAQPPTLACISLCKTLDTVDTHPLALLSGPVQPNTSPRHPNPTSAPPRPVLAPSCPFATHPLDTPAPRHGTMTPSRKARCLKTPSIQRLLTPTDKRGFVTSEHLRPPA